MIKMCTPQMETDYSSLHHRIQQLESIVDKLVHNVDNFGGQCETRPCNEDEFITIHVDIPQKVSTEIYYI